MGFVFRFFFLSLITAVIAGCNDNSSSNALSLPPFCATQTSIKTSDKGIASIFNLDPMMVSGDPTIGPTSSNLDSFRSNVGISHLTGGGVLGGQYVDVRDKINCNEGYGAFDVQNSFVYSHTDPRFQDAMAYAVGDEFRSQLDRTGYLLPKLPVTIMAHCELMDNAFFTRFTGDSGQVEEVVCLGDSQVTSASYGDDGIVTAHELEHATTTDTYSPTQYLNRFFYDEAGSLNEAISDFMALMFEAPLLSSSLPPPLDPRVFSRWALGTFFTNMEATRGAHQCPAWDSSYPQCTGFTSTSKFAVGSTGSTISYIYPDGLGWPYGKRSFGGPPYTARNAYFKYSAQEEIHNAGILMSGALWDVYAAILANHSGNAAVAQSMATQVVLEAIKHLPKPSSIHLSPVNFINFASAVVSSAALLNFSSTDQTVITQVLTNRGLYGGALLDSTWATTPAGSVPQIRVLDNPNILQIWLSDMGSDPSLVTQGIQTGTNGKLDPGEVDAIWFDIPNQSDITAAGVEVAVSIPSPDNNYVSFLDTNTNIGGISTSQAQIMYGKINGKAILNELSSQDPTYGVPTGNDYFLTNPFFESSYKTAIWVRVAPGTPHGTAIHFNVTATPSNGAASTIQFQTTVN